MGVAMRQEWHGDEVARLGREAVAAGLPRAAAVVQAHHKLKLSGASPGKAGGPPGVVTGNLRNSITSNIDAANLSAQIGTNVKYGRWLEYGFVATPKAAKAMPVPLNREARRMLARLSIDGEGTRASLKTANLTYVPRKGKPPLLVKITGRGRSQRFTPMFVLLKVVRVAPRPWVVPDKPTQAQAEYVWSRAAAKYVAENAGRVGGGGAR